jgi:NADPH:quinone reductase-like Zn-dependent oxidoreductase
MEQQAVLIDEFGDADKLKSIARQVSDDLKANEIRVEVHYSGINYADVVMRLGFYRDAPPKPFVPGYELSGVITAIGSDVTRFELGEHVMAGTRFGGYVNTIVLEDWQVIKMPSGLTLEEAAATPVNFITAYLALHEFGRIREGDKVLIDCATGGVGVFALQMAKQVGAQAIGLTSTKSKKEFIESYGATAYTHEEFAVSKENNFDFVLNASGGNSLKMQYQLLNKAGKLCCIGLQSGISEGKRNIFRFLKTALQMPKFNMIKLTMESRMVGGFNALKFFDDEAWMKKIIMRIEQNQIKPFVGKVFDAADVTDAHHYLEMKKAKGKVLIKWKH